LGTYRDGLPVSSSNHAQCGATTLIVTNMLPLHHTVNSVLCLVNMAAQWVQFTLAVNVSMHLQLNYVCIKCARCSCICYFCVP